MSKYIIISKSPKGNHSHIDSTVKYIVKGSNKVHNCKMTYITIEGNSEYVFLDKSKTGVSNTHCGYFGIINKDDALEFIEEVKKYQKGGSYRKTHPIPDNIEY